MYLNSDPDKAIVNFEKVIDSIALITSNLTFMLSPFVHRYHYTISITVAFKITSEPISPLCLCHPKKLISSLAPLEYAHRRSRCCGTISKTTPRMTPRFVLVRGGAYDARSSRLTPITLPTHIQRLHCHQRTCMMYINRI